jgi:adenosylcobinamide-phosphate synthase
VPRPRDRGASIALGLAAGAALDAAFADPSRFHPVAGFGCAATVAERHLYADSRPAGAGFAAVCVGGAVATAVAVGRASSGRPGLTAAAVTWAVLGGTSLRRQGRRLGDELGRADLVAARIRLPTLCGRDPAALDGPGLARAGVESLAENTSDAVVAPLLWGAVAGVPGLVGYRAVNTLDAMVGHRAPRYRRFGWAAARLDDLANLAPARLTALLTCAFSPLVGGSPARTWRVLRRDGGSHPSPNAGRVEAAFAGALGLRLGGPLRYAHGHQERPALGDGRPADGTDLARAARLSGAVTVGAVALSAALAVLLGRVSGGRR